MSWNHFNDFKYISVAERKQQALKKMKTLQQSGAQLKPVAPASTRGLIANSFWGKAWCKHLEAFSDYAYRLPRGRSYIRHSAVIDLQIQPQTTTATITSHLAAVVHPSPASPLPPQHQHATQHHISFCFRSSA